MPHSECNISFWLTDTQTDMLLGKARSTICVQRLDDSLNSAIHIIYRTWLRSSSMHEPRDPPSKVFPFRIFATETVFPFVLYREQKKATAPGADDG